jgi:hypothetical protein
MALAKVKVLDESTSLPWGNSVYYIKCIANSLPISVTVPSAGARHSFETCLFIHRVETLSQGLYRYLPLSHELVLIFGTDRAKSTLG